MLDLLLKAKHWLEPNVLDADDCQRIARLNRIFLVIFCSLAALRGLSVLGAFPASAPSVTLTVLTVLAGLALLWSQRLGRVRLTMYLTAAMFWLVVNLAAIIAGGIDRPLFAANVTILIFIALTLGARVTAVVGLATILAGAAMFAARMSGLLRASTLPTNLFVDSTNQLINVAAAALYLGLAAQSIQAALSLARQNARALAERNEALSREIAERREAEAKLRAGEQNLQALYLTTRRQAQELALLDQVRTALAREVELPTLMHTVVEAVAASFGYSHVSIYLLDGDALIMQHEVGYGDRAFPRIPLTHGIIGKVASTGQPVLLVDVAADPAYLEAADAVVSEVCVPLMDQGLVAGIFNIESTGSQRLGEADLRLMQALSEHITLAMRQARLLSQTLNSEKRFRALVEHSADAIALVGPEGTIRYRSPVASRLLGYEGQEYVGRNLSDWLHPDDRPIVAALFGQVMQAPGAHATAEVRFHHRSGAWLWIEGTATNLLAEPSVQAIVVNYHDITARKQAEQALRDSEERFRRLSEASFEGVLIHDQGIIIDANQALATLFGFSSPDELIGQNGLEVLPMAPESRAIIQANIRTGATEPIDIAVIKPDGTTFPAETRGRDFIVDGRAHRVVTMRDVSERKRAEAELRLRLAERDAVAKVSTVLRAAETLDEMLPMLLDETLVVLNTGAGSILLYDSGTDRLSQAVGRGWFAALALPPHKADEGLAGLVFTSGELYRSADYATDPRGRASVRARVPPGWGGVCVPIRSARQVVGVMFVAVEAPRRLFDDEVHLLTTLAEIAGSAIQRTRLHEQTERNLQRLAALRAIDLAIVSNFDAKTSLQVLLNEAAAHIGADATTVLRHNPHLQQLEVVAARGFRAPVPQNSLQLGDTYAGQVVRERHVVSIADVREQPAFGLRSALYQDEGFVAYHGVPLMAKGQVKGVLEVFQRHSLALDPERLAFLDSLAGQAAIAIENAELFEELQRSNTELVLAYDATIEGWSRTLDVREHDTADHTRRVTEMVLRLAQAMGVPADDLVHIRRGALLHDIGKMSIPDAILLKPGPLTPTEWTVMRQHPQVAFTLLFPIPFLRPALDIPYCHHEKWDGTGYPRGLNGPEISPPARLFAVVDVWDALRFDRPYRLAWPEAKVLAYIREQSGRHFDPQVAAAFLKLVEEDTGINSRG